MSNRYIVTLKFVVFPLCVVPLGVLVYQAITGTLGPDPVATITHQTGFWALYMLLISLAITPVRRFNRHLAWLIRFRRMLGLFAFFYATLHLVTYVWLYSSFNLQAIAHDIVKRPFITVGFFGWLILLALAATSTKWSIRKLGKRWQMLHRTVYLAAIAGVIHYWWIVKTGVRTPWKVTVVLAILLLARLGWTAMESARKKHLAVAA